MAGLPHVCIEDLQVVFLSKLEQSECLLMSSHMLYLIKVGGICLLTLEGKMKHICTWALFVLLTLSASAFELPSALVVELNDDTAEQARYAEYVPVALAKLDLENLHIRPVFYEPQDDFHKELWMRHELNRWFEVRWDNGADAASIYGQIKTDSEVLTVEISEYHVAQVYPDDFNNYTMWGLNQMDLPDAWDIVTGDTSVVITTIDTGCEIFHEDLAANIHVNPDEDINGNGVFDTTSVDDGGDLDGIDNDNNGFVDDVAGWDFVSIDREDVEQIYGVPEGEEYSPRDNKVWHDIHGHGTHVAGTSASVTDNDIGVPSASWNVRSMPLRAGYSILIGGSTLYGVGYPVDFSAAIQYAADNGARIISISFGGGGSLQAYQNAINYARNLGTLTLAAAGNEGSSAQSYPAAYNNVIAVAATSPGDVVANFSNYGTWVDLAAPGTSIWSTISNNLYHNYNYVAWDGTSMACPNAAGVAGLILSLDPEMSVDRLEELLLIGCDNIDSFNPGYANMLGAGRVNAYNSLVLAQSPHLTITDMQMSDPNDNGRIDPGETIDVVITVACDADWENATDVAALMTLDDDNIDIVTAGVNLGDLAAGETTDNSGTPFQFTVPADWETGRMVEMGITLTAQPGDFVLQETWSILIGVPGVILVDDDGGADFDSYLQSDLNELEIIFQTVSAAEATPDITAFDGCNKVIWLTGDVDQPLSESDQQLIQGMLAAGKRVFLFGQNIDEQLTGTDFYHDVLKAESDADATTQQALTASDGAAGPVITGSQLALLGAGDGAGNSTDPDAIIPQGGAVAAYNYVSGGGIGALYFETETYKLMYCAFAVEAITGAGPTIRRVELLEAALNWFDAPVGVAPEFGTSLPTEFAVQSAWPNPFNPTVSLSVALPSAGNIQVEVVDVLGRQVATWTEHRMQAGYRTITWNGAEAASGVYFIRLMHESGLNAIQRVVLLK